MFGKLCVIYHLFPYIYVQYEYFIDTSNGFYNLSFYVSSTILYLISLEVCIYSCAT